MSRPLFNDKEVAKIVAKAPPHDDGPDTTAFERMAIDLRNCRIERDAALAREAAAEQRGYERGSLEQLYVSGTYTKQVEAEAYELGQRDMRERAAFDLRDFDLRPSLSNQYPEDFWRGASLMRQEAAKRVAALPIVPVASRAPAQEKP